MSTPNASQELTVLGKMTPDRAAAKLRELGESEVADAVQSAPPVAPGGMSYGLGDLVKSLRQPAPYLNTAHAFGYLKPAPPGTDTLPILHAGNISPDATLKKARIKITLNHLRVAKYPGGGMHQILFDFYAQNQVPGKVEDVHFNGAYRAQEGQAVGLIGFPIFVGLNVGPNGVGFKCLTVNVRNDDDQKLLAFLESDVFKAGLQLATTAQPAIAPLTGMAVGLTKAIGARNQNVAVQEFYMGLDFSEDPGGARLATGSYLAVQIPQSEVLAWDWDEWCFSPTSGQVVNKADPKQLIPYNYVIFGVSRYEEP